MKSLGGGHLPPCAPPPAPPLGLNPVFGTAKGVLFSKCSSFQGVLSTVGYSVLLTYGVDGDHLYEGHGEEDEEQWEEDPEEVFEEWRSQWH